MNFDKVGMKSSLAPFHNLVDDIKHLIDDTPFLHQLIKRSTFGKHENSSTVQRLRSLLLRYMDENIQVT